LLDDAPTFSLEGVRGTATLVDVDKEVSSHHVGVTGAKMDMSAKLSSVELLFLQEQATLHLMCD
jgi:hypothetical protein